MIIKTDFQIQDAVLTLTVNGEQKEYSVQWCSTSCSVGGTMIGVSNNSGSCLMGLPGIGGPYPIGGAYGGAAGYTGTNGYTYKLTEIPKVTEEDPKVDEDAIIEIMNIAIYGASRKAVEQGDDIQEAMGRVCRLFKDAGFIK